MLHCCRSLENLIFEGKYPQNGIDEIKPYILARMPWAQSLKREDIKAKGAYLRFMSLMFAAMYTFSVNGRLGGIQSISYGQRRELLEVGHTLTSTFKTCATYNYQPVIVDFQVARELLLVYINTVRTLDSNLCTESSPLWVSFEGNEMDSHSIGNLVQKFFVKECRLQLTSTLLRGLIESHAEERYRKGEISLAARQSVHTINGHSAETAKRFYVRTDRNWEVCHSRELFQSTNDNTSSVLSLCSTNDNTSSVPIEECRLDDLPIEDDGYLNIDLDISNLSQLTPQHSIAGVEETYPTSTEIQTPEKKRDDQSSSTPEINQLVESVNSNQSAFYISPISSVCPIPVQIPAPVSVSSFPTAATYSPKRLTVWTDFDWGSNHQDYGKDTHRATWTKDEISYIASFCEKYSYLKNLAAECLKVIWHDPLAVPIFHRNHIENSARLRTGLDIWKKSQL